MPRDRFPVPARVGVNPALARPHQIPLIFVSVAVAAKPDGVEVGNSFVVSAVLLRASSCMGSGFDMLIRAWGL